MRCLHMGWSLCRKILVEPLQGDDGTIVADVVVMHAASELVLAMPCLSDTRLLRKFSGLECRLRIHS